MAHNKHKKEFTRREFIDWTSTGVAALAFESTAVSRPTDAAILLPQKGMPDGATVVSLRNGGSKLELYHGPEGYGIALFIRINGKMKRVAYTPCPVRIFYGRCSAGSMVDVAFHHAEKITDGIRASARFIDRRFH
jgi:hypothetical protein